MSGKVKITTAHITVTRMHDPAQLALEQALNGTGQSLIWRSVVPLFAADDQSLDKTGVIHVVKGDLLVEFGTGTLFHYDGAFFLVTAAHVVPGWEKKGLEVRIGVDDRSLRLSPGIDATVSDSDLDISVIRLNAQAAWSLAQSHSFLKEAAFCLDDELEDGKYVIPGFLAHGCHFSADRQSLSLADFNLWTRPICGPGDADPAFGFFEFPKRPTFGDDQLGVTEALPTTAGLSGAPVWQICRNDEDVLSDWTWESIRVVGVQISECANSDGGWIRCVLWKYMMPLIEQMGR